MQKQPSSPRMSWPGVTGAMCGISAILLGVLVLFGWTVHSPVLVQFVPGLAPMQRNTAVSFALTGIALLAIVWSKPRLALITSAITCALATATLFEYLLHANFG